MTCPHCGFENPDHEAVCFRCGQNVDLGDVEVVPERVRRGRSGNPAWERLRVRWKHHHDRLAPHPRALAAMALLESLVPGLGHRLMGQARRGGIFVGVWLAALVVRFVLDPPPWYGFGAVLDWLLLPHLLPLSAHASLMADAYASRLRMQGRRAGGPELALVSAASVVLLFSIGFAGHPFREPYRDYVVGELADPSLRPGDRVRIRLRPPEVLQRGQVLFFRTPWDLGPNFRELLGTVRAVSGDEVRWDGSSLFVNGEPQPTDRIDCLSDVPDGAVELGRGEAFVLPPLNLKLTDLDQAVIGPGQIRGLAVAIVAPPARRQNL